MPALGSFHALGQYSGEITQNRTFRQSTANDCTEPTVPIPSVEMIVSDARQADIAIQEMAQSSHSLQDRPVLATVLEFRKEV